MVPQLLFAVALAQDLPPEVRLPKDAEGAALVSVVVSTGVVALGIEGPVSDRWIESVGLRGGVGPALNLTPDGPGDVMFGTFAVPYVRFGHHRLHAEGYVGPALLIGDGASAAFVSGGAFEVDLSTHMSLRVGAASYVSLATALPSLGAQEDDIRIGLAPDLGVSLRW